jgi:hypothetical protein
MRDLAGFDVRGPVRTLETHFAEWNPEAADWRPLRIRYIAMFRRDGQLREMHHHNPDGSVPRDVRIYDEQDRLIEGQWWANDVQTTRELHTYDAAGRRASSVTFNADGTTRQTELCRYDAHGRKTKVVFLVSPENVAASCSTGACGIHYAIEGTDFACSAPGATTSTTIYDERDLPSEVTFRDASENVVRRVVFSRNTDGRALSERMEFAGSEAELLKPVFEDSPSFLTTHAYDGKGRRIETIRRMGKVSEERVTVRYDDFDNPIEQRSVDLSRDIQLDDGVVKSEERPALVQHARFEYQYDAYGNWTERIISQRTEPDADERPSNIERRTIAYHEPSPDDPRGLRAVPL